MGYKVTATCNGRPLREEDKQRLESKFLTRIYGQIKEVNPNDKGHTRTSILRQGKGLAGSAGRVAEAT